MLPAVQDDPRERSREEDEQQTKNQREISYCAGRIRQPHRYCAELCLSQSWSRGTHRADNFPKRSNKISITAAMLNTRNTSFRESCQTLLRLQAVPLECRPWASSHTSPASV